MKDAVVDEPLMKNPRLEPMVLYFSSKPFKSSHAAEVYCDVEIVRQDRLRKKAEVIEVERNVRMREINSVSVTETPITDGGEGESYFAILENCSAGPVSLLPLPSTVPLRPAHAAFSNVQFALMPPTLGTAEGSDIQWWALLFFLLVTLPTVFYFFTVENRKDKKKRGDERNEVKEDEGRNDGKVDFVALSESDDDDGNDSLSTPSKDKDEDKDKENACPSNTSDAARAKRRVSLKEVLSPDAHILEWDFPSQNDQEGWRAAFAEIYAESP